MEISYKYPYRIATLLYCFNGRGEILLLERVQEPNCGFWSPCGGGSAASFFFTSNKNISQCVWP